MSNTTTFPTVGIDDLSVYIPSLLVDIKDFAKRRNIDPSKLENGLGLKAFAIPDSSEDVITMAAEALVDIVEKNNLLPDQIGRIYVGTESMVDSSKPIASYLLGVLKKYYNHKLISTEFLNRCDVVDMTFACIGAVDAMQNSLDWLKLNPDSNAIVIATDWAKYELLSPGECTQGAGAIAVLLSANPRILEIGNTWGISSQCEHDFFKPLRRKVRYDDLVASNGVDKSFLGREIYTIYKDTPVYDGHFSNECYTSRISEAFDHFKSKNDSIHDPLEKWSELIFHLPYAYHGRRVFISLYIEYLKRTGQWQSVIASLSDLVPIEDPTYEKQIIKAISKTGKYKTFVSEKIESGERASSFVGNMYTGSIFLSLLSSLSTNSNKDLTNNHLGFFAYGSGSKSKVFEGKVMPGYRKLVDRINLFDRLEARQSVSMDHYEYLHREKCLFNLDSSERKVFQTSSGSTPTNLYARTYNLVK